MALPLWRPTPTQAENDRAREGEHVIEKEPDGSPVYGSLPSEPDEPDEPPEPPVIPPGGNGDEEPEPNGDDV